MQPIQDLLSRIRWDPALAGARFEVGYLDRVTGSETVVPVSALRFDPGTPNAFTIVDDEGAARHIPLHRVRRVYRDGLIVWQRPDRTLADE